MKFFFIKQKRGSTKHVRDRKSMHPIREWLIGLCAAVGVFLGGVAFIAYDFHVQFVLPPEVPEVGEAQIQYSERDVTFYADRYRARDARFMELRTGVSAPAEEMPVTESESVPATAEDEPLAPEEVTEYTNPTLSP
jgi:hypothetical protein